MCNMILAPDIETTPLRALPEGWLIRPRTQEDIPAVVELMRRVYRAPHTPEAVWPAETLQEHGRHFPQGQLSMFDDQGNLVADSTAMRVDSTRALGPHRWTEITQRGTLASHDPEGEVFYGVDLAVEPRCQGMGLGRLLYDRRIELARLIGCTAFVAGARMPGYHLAAQHLSPGEYLSLVRRRLFYDPTLSKQLRIGFKAIRLLPDYITDPESCNHAALIMMAL